ncbi:esterase [Methylobacterium sp. J-076]|uniref:esterase n=1 Tax=Methylobacterium sp. J-076 TaxID=2836655 RepID=UPI001FB8AA23|nr:esterase [Methylobacterium sp. J-076]MCJ2010978.1 esterase [Methylobacterium sp. J-076]
MLRALFGLAALAAASVPATAAEAPPPPLTISAQGSFFVGGRDVASESLSTLPAYAAAGTITVDQVYVRYQIPVSPTRTPLVLIHGCCLTGKTWETTPDGRMGWDEYFVRQGFPTYVIDQSWRGRSAGSPAAINAVKSGKANPDTLPAVFSAGREPAWTIFRFGPEFPKVFAGMQFPLEAQAEFWKQMVPDWSASLPVPNPTVPALSELAKRLKSAVLVSHSQSGIYPFQTAALDRSGIRAIVAIEPAACPDPAKDDLAPYKDLPILVLFGDYVDQSSRWAPRLKLCRAFVAAANAAGGRAELILLPEIGIHGNSHMLMQDKNSLEIADWLSGWLDKRAPVKG